MLNCVILGGAEAEAQFDQDPRPVRSSITDATPEVCAEGDQTGSGRGGKCDKGTSSHYATYSVTTAGGVDSTDKQLDTKPILAATTLCFFAVMQVEELTAPSV